MLWWKAWHIIAIVSWFAGLFYLPRLFVYHAQSSDKISLDRFHIMERRLYYGIMWPAAILTTVCGVMVFTYAKDYYLGSLWFKWKIALVLALWIYHWCCGYFLKQFAVGRNHYSSGFFRAWNEVPTIILILVVLLVVIKP